MGVSLLSTTLPLMPRSLNYLYCLCPSVRVPFTSTSRQVLLVPRPRPAQPLWVLFHPTSFPDTLWETVALLADSGFSHPTPSETLCLRFCLVPCLERVAPELSADASASAVPESVLLTHLPQCQLATCFFRLLFYQHPYCDRVRQFGRKRSDTFPQRARMPCYLHERRPPPHCL